MVLDTDGQPLVNAQAGMNIRGVLSQQPNSSQKEDTTYFCVVDKWGNAVSQLQSLQMPFGSSIVAGDTGILLNN